MSKAPDKIVGEVFITHIDALNEIVRVRGIKEAVYLEDGITGSKMIGTGKAKVKIERDDDGDLVMRKYEVVPDVVATPLTQPTYTVQRAATVRLTQAIREYLNVRYPGGDIPLPKDSIDGHLDVWLAIHGDVGTPGMVFPDAGNGVFIWEIVREAVRLLKLDGLGAYTHERRRVLKLLENLLASAPNMDIDVAELVNTEGGIMESVIFHALQIAAERFNPDPADPGWTAEMHEDALRDVCLAYTQAFLTRRAHDSPS